MACGDTSEDNEPANNDPNPGPELKCTDFEACGGDIVGDWNIVGLGPCLPPARIDPDCPEAINETVFTVISGNLDFNADNTYTQNLAFTLTFRVVLPKSCIADCSMLVGDLDCNDTGDACDCEETAQENKTETGTWAVEGNTLTFTPDDDDTDPFEVAFCVSGDSAILQETIEILGSVRVNETQLERK